MKNCPNCGYQNNPTETECSKCGIVFKKWFAVKKAEEEAAKAEKSAVRNPNNEAEKLRREWETKKETIARRVQSGSYSGGTEDKLEKTGFFFAFLSAISLIVGALVGYNLNPIWFAVGIIGFIQALIAAIIFEGGADVIRLLKKLNGLPYGGLISTVAPRAIYRRCSVCSCKLSDSDKFCPRCGRVFAD